MTIPLTQEQKERIWEEINDRFDPDFCDYLEVTTFVCDLYGIDTKDIEY